MAQNRADSCFCCGSASRLALHHLTYDRLGEEIPEDVVTVCGSCHGKIHRLVAKGEAFLSWAHEYWKDQVAKKGRPPTKYQPRRRGPDQSLAGRRFGQKLVVVSYFGPPKKLGKKRSGGSLWTCRCDCGRLKAVGRHTLRRREEANSPSCITGKLSCPPKST